MMHSDGDMMTMGLLLLLLLHMQTPANELTIRVWRNPGDLRAPTGTELSTDGLQDAWWPFSKAVYCGGCKSILQNIIKRNHEIVSVGFTCTVPTGAS